MKVGACGKGRVWPKPFENRIRCGFEILRDFCRMQETKSVSSYTLLSSNLL